MSIRRTSIVLVLVVALLSSWGAVARAGTGDLPPSLSAAATTVHSRAVPPATSHRRLFVPGEVLVEFRAGVRAPQRGRVSGSVGARIVRQLPDTACAPGATLVLVRSSSLTTAELMKHFSADPSVARVSPNYWRRVTATVPDDPGLVSQWGLIRVGAGDAWARTTGSADVVVASIDTGVDVLHPDLAPNMWRNPGEVDGNGVDDDGNGYVDDVYGIDTVNNDSVPMDDYGHGTHTSGIMAGIGANGAGIAGLGWSTQVMALKFIDYQGWGTDADAVECIDYVIKEKLAGAANVVAINASWGGEPGNLFLRNAIMSAGEAGIVFCASAGNDGEDNDQYPMYPAAYDCPNILSVAATGKNDALTGWSNYGDCTVDLAAPGNAILSTLPDEQYAAWSGTSMAAPFVTGTVALSAVLHPDETVQQRVDRILSTVRKVKALQGTCMTGGVLDVPAALGLPEAAGDTQAPVTTAMGADDRPHDIPTDVSFLASDGADGSGVAVTEWRLDGGEWTAGDAVRVPAPRHVAMVHTIEYRSTDRAGNAEDVKTCQVTIDTTAPGDNSMPGRAPLPVSPVVGGVSNGDPMDCYRLPLQRGQSFALALDPSLPGMSAPIALFGPRGNLVRLVWPEWGTSARMAYRVSDSGTYTLGVFCMFGPTPYAFSYQIAPRAVDIVPPALAVHGPRGGWHNVPVALTFTAVDDLWGSGVLRTEMSLDDGLSWHASGGVVVDAPLDHSNDGTHHVLSRAVDTIGNVSDRKSTWVRIDTAGPTTEAWTEFVGRMRRGQFVVIGFRVHDRTPEVRCQLIIRSAATGDVVARRDLGWCMSTEYVWWENDYSEFTFLQLDLRRGVYNVKIGGTTRDAAGNRWTKAICTKQLVIK